MNLSIEQIATWFGMLLGLAGVWFRTQFKIERLTEKNDEQVRQVEALWKWKDIHEKESTSFREVFNRELSELRGSVLVTNEQFKQIMGMLIDIKDRLARLENGR